MNLEAMQGVTLAVAGAQDPEGVLRQIVQGIAVCRNVALARIWCVQVQPTDRGEERWLQLAASAGNLVEDGADAEALDDRTARCAWGEGPIGRIAASGEGQLVPDVDTWPGGLSDPLWAAREGVRCFAAQPLIVKGEVFGVLAVFDRQEVAAPDFAWLRTFADHAAVAISNARAFDEIQRLKQQLEKGRFQRRKMLDRAVQRRQQRGPAVHGLLIAPIGGPPDLLCRFLRLRLVRRAEEKLQPEGTARLFGGL